MKRYRHEMTVEYCSMHSWWCTHRNGVCATRGNIPQYDPVEAEAEAHSRRAAPFVHGSRRR